MAAAFADTLSQVSTIADMWPGNHAALAGAGMVKAGVDALTGYGVGKLQSMLTATLIGGSPEVQAAVRAVATTYGWGTGKQWDDLWSLIMGESSGNPGAANPTSSARGLFQKMTSIHGPIEPTVQGQTQWGLEYIRRTYGSPSGAWAAWLSRDPHWYDEGGLAVGKGWMPKNTLEPERVLSPAQTRAFEAALSRLGRDGYASVGSTETKSMQVTNHIYPSEGMDERAVAVDVSRRTVFKLRTR
jgi:hypothetical protein